MKKPVSLLLCSAVIHLSIGPDVARAAVAVAATAVKVAPVPGLTGAAGASVASVDVLGSLNRGMSVDPLRLGSVLYNPAAVTPSAVDDGFQAPSIDDGVSVTFQSAPAITVREKQIPGRMPVVKAAQGAAAAKTVRGSLEMMKTAVQMKPGQNRTGIGGKLNLDKIWDRSRQHEVSPEVDATDIAFTAAPKKRVLKPADPKQKGKRRRMLVLPVAMAGIGALPKLMHQAVRHPAVQSLIGQFVAVVSALPDWVQTGVWVGSGFAAAWALPKVVRVAGKWVFNQVEWDELRESYLVNLASAAAWFGAISYAVYMVGGLSALGVNAGLFAATMALANQDLAKNLASGFQLYRNREHEYDFDDEISIWGEKGRLESINVRFMTLDTSENKDVEYDRVMMANESVRSLGIANHSPGRKGGLLLGAALIPAVFTGVYAPYITIAALWFAGALAKEWSTGIRERADMSLPDRERYKKLRARSRIVDLAANASYIAGLIFIMNLFGVPVTGMVTAIGLLSAAAGFWTKEVAGDLIAGLMIAVWRPFGMGDVIEVGKHPRGEVETITPRTIRLRLKDGSAYFVPLEDLMKEKVRIGLKTAPAAG